MTDAVTTNVVFNGSNKYVVQLTNICDGTGESEVKKVDISTLAGTLGTVPDNLALQEVQWNINGFTSVLIAWDATTDDTMLVLNGNGYKDFRDVGGLIDPQSTGSTGDVMLTTAGNAAGDSYDIVASFKLRG